MANFSVDSTKTILGIREFENRVFAAFEDALKATARTAMIRILDRIPDPPTPAGQVYQRTGRLVAGYGAAANFLGLSVRASSEGSYTWSSSPSGIRFTFTNSVPYASGVEWAGPWSIPPNAIGGPQRYGEEHGKHAVLFSMLATEGEMFANFSKAWTRSLP